MVDEFLVPVVSTALAENSTLSLLPITVPEALGGSLNFGVLIALRKGGGSLLALPDDTLEFGC